MGVSILSLVLTGCVIAVATGVDVALALGVVLAFVPTPSTVATPVTTTAVAAVGARSISDGTHPTLSRRVTAVCQQSDSPRPAIHVAPIDSPFSLTTGITPASARLVVSEGVLACSTTTNSRRSSSTRSPISRTVTWRS